MALSGFGLPDGVWRSLSQWGLLLESDRLLPSVASIVSGGPIKGSWWGSANAGGTYQVLAALDDRTDVLRVKLVSGKVTFVLERLWPAVLVVAAAREAWQLADLLPEALSLLELVDRAGHLRLDELPGASRGHREGARELERRLLLHGSQIHTASGAHTKQLSTWAVWACEKKWQPPPLAVEVAKAVLEEAVGALNAEFRARAYLPWQAKSSPQRRSR